MLGISLDHLYIPIGFVPEVTVELKLSICTVKIESIAIR